jgi:hypothetical protein
MLEVGEPIPEPHTSVDYVDVAIVAGYSNARGPPLAGPLKLLNGGV